MHMDRLQLCFCERRDAESRKEVKLCGLSIDEAACGQKEMRTDEGLERRSGSSRDQHRDEARAMAESSRARCFSALITLSAGGLGPLSNWVKRAENHLRARRRRARRGFETNTSSRPLHLLSFALTIPGFSGIPTWTLPLHVAHSRLRLTGLLRQFRRFRKSQSSPTQVPRPAVLAEYPIFGR